MKEKAQKRAGGLRARFLLSFATGMGLLIVVFDGFRSVFDRLYLYPVSWTSAALLNRAGVPAHLDAGSLSTGFCQLSLGEVRFRVIPECTGIFALFVFLAALSAYPAASLLRKFQGLLLALPSFFAYGSLRLAALGLVGYFEPAWIRFFHLYLMVLLNLGFLAFLWTYWVDKVPDHDRS